MLLVAGLAGADQIHRLVPPTRLRPYLRWFGIVSTGRPSFADCSRYFEPAKEPADCINGVAAATPPERDRYQMDC